MTAHLISNNDNACIMALSEEASFYYQTIAVDQKLVAFMPDQVFLQVSATDWNGEREPTRDFYLTNGEMDDLIQAYHAYHADDDLASVAPTADHVASEHGSREEVTQSEDLPCWDCGTYHPEDGGLLGCSAQKSEKVNQPPAISPQTERLSLQLFLLALLFCLLMLTFHLTFRLDILPTF